MNISYDVPTYPNLGKIYPGDYFEKLPFDEYIDRKQELPEGERVFDIRNFGAVAEQDRLNTEAFHRAAEACREAGGGTILVAGGSYRMGTVWIPSDTTLFIASDSEIVASRNSDLLIAPVAEMFDDHGDESSEGAFVRIRNANNVTITGGGRISGSGEWFVYEPKELPSLTPFDTTMIPRRDQFDVINCVPGTIRYYYRQRIRYAEDKYGEGKPVLRRPSYMVWVQESSNITIENIVLHDSMSWTLNLDSSKNITVRNTVIDDNRHVANTDGIDITGSSDIKIEHCFISCADDGIVVKNPIHTQRMMEHIHVKDCTVITVMNSFKIGTETGNDIRDVLVENCHFCMPDIYPGSVSGISLESCDGTHLSSVRIRNITMDKIVCPLYICLNKRNRYQEPYTDEVDSNRYWGGSINGITIENVKAVNAELPSIITGYETEKRDGTKVRKAVTNIKISGFHVEYRDNQEIVSVPEQIEEFLHDYPESNAHGDVDACGIWARHVDGLILEDIYIRPRTANTRPKVRLTDVREASGSECV